MPRRWNWRLRSSGRTRRGPPRRWPGSCGRRRGGRRRSRRCCACFYRLELIGPAAGDAPVVFGRFEAENPNDRWTGDALHGPKIGGRKTYLFAFLDDHSRLICWLPVRIRRGHRAPRSRVGTGAGCVAGFRPVCMSTTGRRFVDAWLLRACAKLGIRLVHSTPHRPQAAARSNDSSAPCASSSSSNSPTPPPRSWPQPYRSPLPHC